MWGSFDPSNWGGGVSVLGFGKVGVALGRHQARGRVVGALLVGMRVALDGLGRLGLGHSVWMVNPRACLAKSAPFRWATAVRFDKEF